MDEPNSIKTQSPITQNPPPKPYSNFVYKAAFVFVLIVLLPLFPSSQSPEHANNTILKTSWELIHLLIVGIAISYGLFSKKNSEPETKKETHTKVDTPHSYVSCILQVSSVFDDEELVSPKGLHFQEETRNQTWKYSQYHRERPMVIVAEESTEGTNASTKPSFLPVRSFKSRPEYSESSIYGYGNDEAPLNSNQMNEVGKNGKIDGGKEGIVLPSPIPWGSRSGRTEAKAESPLLPYCPPNSATYEELGSSETPFFQPPSTPYSDSTTPSPNRLPPSASLSAEIRGKAKEDLVIRKKSFNKHLPPPPPPPPPRPLRSISHFVTERREDERKSFKEELEDLTSRGRGRLYSNDWGSNSFSSESSSYTRRSVTRVGSKEAQSSPPLTRNQKQKNEFRKKMIITSDSDSEDDDYDDDSEISDEEEASNPVTMEATPQEENEVDKKAEEFIANFREQMRIQRIASIKKSTRQRKARSSE